MRAGFTILYEVLSGIFIFLAVSIVVFFLARLLGDPFTQLEQDPFIDPQTLEELRSVFGYDKPLFVQYISYLVNLLHGDLGYSTYFNKPVSNIIAERLPFTLALLIPSITVSNVLAYRLGLEAGWRGKTAIGKILFVFFVCMRSIPYIVFAIVMLCLFASVGLPTYGAWSPQTEGSLLDRVIDVLMHYIPPFMSLTLKTAFSYALYIRQYTISVLDKEFIFVAQAKGLPDNFVKLKHVGRYILPPAIALLGIRYAFMIEGAIITETIFTYPGMGYTLIEAVRNCDCWLLQGVATILTLCIVVSTIVIDAVYRLLDPRTSS